jgi:hypothetical protein
MAIPDINIFSIINEVLLGNGESEVPLIVVDAVPLD